MNDNEFHQRVVSALEDIVIELSDLNDSLLELGAGLSGASDHLQDLAGDARDANSLTNSWGRTLNVALAAIAEAVGSGE